MEIDAAFGYRVMATTTALFIVIFARSKWWIDLNGKSKGPFLTRETAELEAVNIASTYARKGRRAEVQVAEPGKKNRIVWQSAEQGILGRAAAVLNH